MKIKMFGFTLAEVLITLGIIGVVAAMTIPTLLSNTNSQKFKSQYKKTVSTLNQAVRMAQAQYDVDLSSISTATSSNSESLPTTTSLTGLFNSTLAGATITSTSPYSTEPAHAQVTTPMYAKLADGSIIIYDKNFKNCTKTSSGVSGSMCVAYIDVNGASLPNQLLNGYDYGATEVAALNPFDTPAYAAPSPTGDGNSNGSGSYTLPQSSITVKTSNVKDIYPVIMYDSTVVPGTKSGLYALTSSK